MAAPIRVAVSGTQLREKGASVALFRRNKQPTAAVVGHPFYHMQQTVQPHAGALSYAFTPLRLLPPQDIIGGMLYRPQRVLPEAPVIAQRAGTQNGLGGIVAGQLVLQPLMVPEGSGGNL
jgi:hypothetical protein